MNYMVCKWISDENNAASKATNDVNKAFNEVGGELIELWSHNNKLIRNFEEIVSYCMLARKVTDLDNIIIQWPLYSIKPLTDESFLNLPHHKIICFIQDIESYRYHPDNYIEIKKDINYLNKFDAVIAHNHGMIDFLRQNGLTTNIVDWQICDYIIDERNIRETQCDKYDLCFIGNLQRSKFLGINSSRFKTHINLYSQSCADITMTPQLSYKGAYIPNDNCCILEGSFGLIWEGSSLDSCEGALGNYMRINNPNRLSLFLANDMPVITWKKAGLAKFIETNQVGFTVDSLSEIDYILSKMSRSKYLEILCNVKRIGKQIRNGFFAKQAIENAIHGNYVSM